jgi:hypothetical protein
VHVPSTHQLVESRGDVVFILPSAVGRGEGVSLHTRKRRESKKKSVTLTAIDGEERSR